MPETTLSAVTNKHFDYIIVGGGTAGLTLAATLSEDPSLSVLVLEAGEPNLNDSKILVLGQIGLTFGDPKYDWAYETVPQQYSSGRCISWNRGKGLGGSSALNFCNWTLPAAADMDAIERLGNPGWNWKEFKKYAYRLEKFKEPTPEQTTKYLYSFTKGSHGDNGPIRTSFPSAISPTLDVSYMKALQTLGLPVMDGYAGDPRGVHVCRITKDPETHARSYSANAFYIPNKDRPNFTVLTSAHVAKVLLDRKASSGEHIATGVEFLHGEDRAAQHTVYANKEVILCAGTIINPQLLELSGIGRKEILKAIGVEVKVELSGVGENLQDHQLTTISFQLDPSTVHETWDRMRDPAFAAEQRKLQLAGEGMHCWAIAAMGFLPLATMNPERSEDLLRKARKDVEKQLAAPTANPGLEEQLYIQLEMLANPEISDTEVLSHPGPSSYTLLGPPQEDMQHHSIFLFTQHPFSRGTVHCTTNDPLQPPAIDPRYFSNDSDLELMVEEMKFLRKLVEVEPFKSVVKHELEPGPERESDEAIREYIRLTNGSSWHACGTCSMLPRGKSGVVDPTLKVYGTLNLRVADLSIIPLEPTGHTQSLAYVIGMKAADILLAEKNKN